MAVAVQPKKQFDYVLEEDRKLLAEKQTVWKLRGLSIGEQADVQDSLRTERTETGETSWKTGTLLLKTLRAGLVGVANFCDDTGLPVAFSSDKSGVVTDDFLDRLAPAWRTELANAIAGAGQLSDKQRD